MPEILVGAKSVCCCCLRCPEELLDMTTGEPSPFDMMSSCFGYVNVQPSTGVLLICSKCNHHLVQSWEFIYKIRATQRLLRTQLCYVDVGTKISAKTRDPLFKELKLIPIAEISGSDPTESRTIAERSSVPLCMDPEKELKTKIGDDSENVELESREVNEELYESAEYDAFEMGAAERDSTDEDSLWNEQFSKIELPVGKLQDEFEIRSKDNSVVFRNLMSQYSYNRLKKVSRVDAASGVKDGVYVVGPRDVTCKICEETFQWPRLLNKHLAEHFPRYVCQICGKRYAFNKGFLAHLNTHDDSVFKCDICDRSFNWKMNLIRHIKDHKFGSFKHRCLMCPEKFTSFYTKMKHLSEVHGDNSKRRNCTMCPQSFLTIGCLRKHVARIHLRKERVECPVCGKKFFTKAELDGHGVIHSEVKAFVCQVCNKSYKRKKTLTEHMRIHTGDKRFQCTFCEKRFTQKCALTGHMKIHQTDCVVISTNKHRK